MGKNKLKKILKKKTNIANSAAAATLAVRSALTYVHVCRCYILILCWLSHGLVTEKRSGYPSLLQVSINKLNIIFYHASVNILVIHEKVLSVKQLLSQ